MKEKIFKFTMLTLIFVFLFTIIINTYAKYITSKDSQAQARVAQWNIKINNEDIETNSDFSSLIQLEYENKEHIAENVIAPTSSGYFILNLESTGTEVPFTYTISMDVAESAVEDYRITSFLKYDGTAYSNPLTDEELEELKTSGTFEVLDSSTSVITDTLTPPVDASGNFTGETVITSFLINFGWLDGEDEVLDNRNDVIASLTAHSTTPTKKGVLLLNLNVEQVDTNTPEP